MNTNEVLKLALEALERHAEMGLLAGATITALREALAEQPAPSQYGSPELQALIVARAMEKNAAEQPAQKCSYPYCGCNSKAWCKVERNEALDKMAENARELGLDYEPAQQQEPVAWKLVPKEPTDEMLKAMDECSTEGYDERLYAGHAASVYMAAVDVAPSPPQRKEPEPVVWMYQDKSTHEVRFQKHMRDFVDHGATYETPLYTTPPAQRTWVGLSDLNIDELENEYMKSAQTAHEFLRAIEAKLKEKNT